jgi:glycerophosphoryl diester phosphodiesterase
MQNASRNRHLPYTWADQTAAQWLRACARRGLKEISMHGKIGSIVLAHVAVLMSTVACVAYAGDDNSQYDTSDSRSSQSHGDADYDSYGRPRKHDEVQVGVRPSYLVQGMDPGKLKDKLLSCENGPFYRTNFSIAHRGAPLQFPEHTKESYTAGARMGAGIVECDVTFTSDGALVCRHDECDLHTTTNIVNTPLNNQCSVPWSGPDGPAPKCCASDITLSQFKTLKGKMDTSNRAATTPEGYLGGTAAWRTDLYNARGTLLTLEESIRLNKRLGVKHTPELKSGNPIRIKAVFGSQEAYAQKMIDTFKAEGVSPRDVWPQSFNKDDVLYWIKSEPRFGKQAVYLDDIDPTATPAVPRLSIAELKELKAKGVQIIAPPIFALLAVENGEIVASQYAKDIRGLGFDIITWSFERSDLRKGAASGGFYWMFDPTGQVVKKDSDMYKGLDALAKKVGVLGVFSDWPGTVSYYASCMGLK